MRSVAFRVSLLGASLLASTAARAQQGPKAVAVGTSEKSSAAPNRAFMGTIGKDIVTGDTVAHLELNLAAQASLSLEGMFASEHEQVGEKEQKETGESILMQSSGAALLISRFTEPQSMSGFYWRLGAGYRQQKAKWHVRPAGNDAEAAAFSLDAEKALNHEAEIQGVTGHGRVGYRYSGTSVPLLIGASVGIRHLAASVDDKRKADNSSELNVQPMTSKEKDRMKRLVETAPEIALEVGFCF